MSKDRTQPSVPVSLRMVVLVVMAMRKNPETWDTGFPGEITGRGYTLHSLYRPFGKHLDDFKLINILVRPQRSEGGNGRIGVYPDYFGNPLPGRFLSPDNHIQSPGNPQNYNRYAYALNNPLKYTDPSGEFLIESIMIAAFINATVQTVSGNVNSTAGFWGSFAVGAASGAAGGVGGHAVAGAYSTATSFGGGVANGALVGAAGGFVGGAGNAWMEGTSFGQSLRAGLVGGGYGAFGGALLGGISGGIQFQKQFRIYTKGCNELGINGENPVPKTDDFLSEAQKAWFKDAPMKKAIRFTVENVPKADLEDMIAKGAPAATVGISKGGEITGNSYVYFNENLAFKSAKTLFFNMGHEFVHVSQFAALTNQPRSLLDMPGFRELLDYHAYSYQHSLGGLKYSSFSRNDVMRLATQHPDYFESLNYMKFNWINNVSKPF